MKKIQSLFKRDYEGTRQIYDEVVPGSEWVLAGEGVPTVKLDGTCCMVRNKQLFKRYDRKLVKSANKRKKGDPNYSPMASDFKPAPNGWEAAEAEPNQHTGHWPGWVVVSNEPQDKWHREAFANYNGPDGTCELIGPKVQGNPYKCVIHTLVPHGERTFQNANPPRTFDKLRKWFSEHDPLEGIVWHHPDGRMVKIKSSDFGFKWPIIPN